MMQKYNQNRNNELKADVIKMLTQTLIKTVSGGKYEQADLRFQFEAKSTLCFN